MKRIKAILGFAMLFVLIAMGASRPTQVMALPGDVVIQGQVTYQPRNLNTPPANWPGAGDIQIQLFHLDLQNNSHLLATVNANRDGNFSFPARPNWWSADNRRLNIFYQVVTTNPRTRVTTRAFANYVFQSTVTLLPGDGVQTKNFAIDQNWLNFQALWIYGDIRNAWHFVNDRYSVNGTPYDAGNVTAVWEESLNCYPLQLPDWVNFRCGSFSYGGVLTHFIFISNQSNTNSADTVIHETAHMFMVNANDYWYTGCLDHSVNRAGSPECAWAEGWADFLPLAVNNDPCYDATTINPSQGQVDVQYFNLETHNRGDSQASFNWGDAVEGRVAGALYDLYDPAGEGYDVVATGFVPIATITLSGAQTQSLSQFWSRWPGVYPDTFNSGLALWLNTIPYITPRQLFLPAVRK